MSTEQLKESLKKLHESMGNATDNVDDELVELLTVLNKDIQHILGKGHQEEGALHHLEDRTLALSAKFAAQNPHLEAILRELSDVLGKMGI